LLQTIPARPIPAQQKMPRRRPIADLGNGAQQIGVPLFRAQAAGANAKPGLRWKAQSIGAPPCGCCPESGSFSGTLCSVVNHPLTASGALPTRPVFWRCPSETQTNAAE